jgi:(p)ppGpp synthase/HD superfamily hydrolase
MTSLDGRFDAALTFASGLHRDDRRKGTDIPYIAHLLSVASLVLEDGGDEDQSIAALLHDAVEDHGVEQLPLIEERFGERVALIVAACSDSMEPAGTPKAPWRERKVAYLEHLRSSADHGYLRVTLADKVHNARSIVLDLREHGGDLWDRFTTRSAEDQLWYYRELLDAFHGRSAAGFSSPLIGELERSVQAMVELAG